MNRIVTELAKTAPNISPQQVVGTGATQIRHAFPPSDVPAIVFAYMSGIKVTLALVVALAGVTCLIGAFVPRRRINALALQGGAA